MIRFESLWPALRAKNKTHNALRCGSLVDAEFIAFARHLPWGRTIAHAQVAGTGAAGWKSAKSCLALYPGAPEIARTNGSLQQSRRYGLAKRPGSGGQNGLWRFQPSRWPYKTAFRSAD